MRDSPLVLYLRTEGVVFLRVWVRPELVLVGQGLMWVVRPIGTTVLGDAVSSSMLLESLFLAELLDVSLDNDAAV